jgi:uncharacterized membrane protein
MGMRSPNAGIGGRTQQAGTLAAATIMPITFQPTLMPRSALDQALVTGISTSLNYAFAALIQDSIEAAALRGAGRTGTDPATVDRRTWRRASVVLDLAAIGAGLAVQSALRPRPDERLPRGGARTAAWWLAATGLSGAIVGVVQELTARPGDTQDHSFPAATFAGAAMAAINDYRRRRWERQFPGVGTDDDAPVSAAKAFAMSLVVTAALTGLAAGERLFAAGVGRAAERVLPGHERLYRPLGHLAALSLLGEALYEMLRRVDHRIERGAEEIEAAYPNPPTSPLVSGGPGSGVAWDTLSRQGRRNVATKVTADQIEQVMGEPALAEPICVYIGLESAPTEAERVALAIAELERTGAFDRSLLMVISPTGTGYVNYVAVESASYLSRGDIASVTMQYSLRPSPLSLDRVAEGRHHYRMLIDAIHNALAERPPEKRPRVVLFGESLGAWTSQDAFAHRGTQGLLNAGVDRALWIGTPYMSKWKEEVLHGDRPDVDRSLVGRFNDFGEVEALDPEARRRLRYVMITHANDAVGHFGLDLLVRAPDWLGPAATRAATVPGAEQWRSPTTFVQTLIDMKNAANVIPGEFEAKGHDYRADLARFVREVYALPASDEQLAAVEQALRAAELERKRVLDAAKAAAKAAVKDGDDGQAGGSGSSSSKATSRS